MTTIKKIMLGTYATIKHLQGYQLLKNPKGTNPYEVNMIKYRHGLSPDMDEIFFYTRICRNFEGFFPKSKNKHLIATHIFDTRKVKMTNKKNIIVYGGGVTGYLRDREDVAEEILDKRNSMSLSLKLKVEEKLDKKEQSRNYYMPQSVLDIFDNILTLGYSSKLKQKIFTNMPKRPGFFQVLRENLSKK